jgi:UDP-N-acetylglucosamine--N-acetylmuramyl-(pentapeptide) pyrophosphoryl-undecaprenol N-acetylglucosamine transferase
VRRPRFSIVHLTGSLSATHRLKRVYERAGVSHGVYPFCEDMGQLYASADLVLCRAGGATLAEVTAAALPCYAVPYPHAVDDHQRANAQALGAGGRIREQAELGMETFDEIADCLADDVQRERFAAHSRELGRPNAAKDVFRRLEALAELNLSAAANNRVVVANER